MPNESYLKVPGKWLEACGLGSEDRIFPVVQIDRSVFPNGRPATFVTVYRGTRDWVIHKEWRKAEFVPADKYRDQVFRDFLGGKIPECECNRLMEASLVNF